MGDVVPETTNLAPPGVLEELFGRSRAGLGVAPAAPRTSLASFWAPKASYQNVSGSDFIHPSRSRAILPAIFNRFSVDFGRFCGQVGDELVVDCEDVNSVAASLNAPAINADPRRHNFILNDRNRSSPFALSRIFLPVPQTTST